MGQDLIRTPPARMLRSFAQDHANAVLIRLFEQKKFGHLAKLPRVICGLWSQVKKCDRSWHKKRSQYRATSIYFEHMICSGPILSWKSSH